MPGYSVVYQWFSLAEQSGKNSAGVRIGHYTNVILSDIRCSQISYRGYSVVYQWFRSATASRSSGKSSAEVRIVHHTTYILSYIRFSPMSYP